MMGHDGEPDITPAALQDAIASPMRTRICIEFWVFGVIYAIVITIAEIYRQDTEDCGIPVILWNEIFFALLLGKLIFVSCTYFGLRGMCSLGCSLAWYIAWSAVFLLALFGWVIYGYIIYFDDDN